MSGTSGNWASDLVGQAIAGYTKITTTQQQNSMAQAQLKQAELLAAVEKQQNAAANVQPLPAVTQSHNAVADSAAGAGPFGLPATTMGVPTKDLLLVAAGLAAVLVIKRID